MHGLNSFSRAVHWICFRRFLQQFGGKVKTFIPIDQIISEKSFLKSVNDSNGGFFRR